MTTIADKITTLAGIKANLKTEIEAKGRDLTAKNFDEWPSEVALIETGTSHLVEWFDYDGTLLEVQYVNDGENGVPPADPVQAGLVFYGWTHNAVAITHDVQIGAMYDTDDGSSRAYITLTTATGLSPTLRFGRVGAGTLTVDWGDATSNWTSTSTGNINTGAHTYAAAGDYVITISITSGATYTFGSGGSSGNFTGGSTQAYRDILTKLEIGSSVIYLRENAFFESRSLELILLSHNITTIENRAFYRCRSLKALIIPTGVEIIGAQSFIGCYPVSVLVLPSTITYIGEDTPTQSIWGGTFQDLRALTSIVIPDSMIRIQGSSFRGCTGLIKLTVASATTHTIGNETFRDCTALRQIDKPSDASNFLRLATGMLRACRALTSVVLPATDAVPADLFIYCYSLKSVAIHTTGPISNGAFYHCRSLESLTIPAGITSIGNAVFEGCSALKELVLEREGTITTLGTGAFTECPSILKIYVPDALVLTYKAASNWLTWADYIYPISERP